MNRIPVLILVLILIFSVETVFSQEDDNSALIEKIEASYSSDTPTWLLMERGKQAYRAGEYGLSSRVFLEVLNREKTYPDAEIWLAYIYEQEGEYLLAEKQYRKALENKTQMYILDDEVTVLYRLAEIYRRTDQYGMYERTLLDILGKDDSDDILQIQYSMMDSIKDTGIDKMFELYRYENTKFAKARAELGVFYYQTGRYTESEINLILPVVSAATTGFNYIYDKTADYDFYNFDLHTANMMQYKEVKDFLLENYFFRNLYYLGASLYADGYEKSAASLWNIVLKYDEDKSTWKSRSERQLRNPFIEPIIRPRS